jgi:D-tyrosyl-tRNA(Tyr) deacylase
VRCVVQEAREASDSVDGQVVGAFGRPGLVVLLGVTHADSEAETVGLAAKVHDLRIPPGERSAAELDAPLLVVSPFTLYADTGKGRRPPDRVVTCFW